MKYSAIGNNSLESINQPIFKNPKQKNMASQKIIDLLGVKAAYLLEHQCKAIERSTLTLPSPRHIEEIWVNSNRGNQVLRSMQALFNYGRLANTGYLSIFPVDQGIEHSAGASFSPNPVYFDPENI